MKTSSSVAGFWQGGFDEAGLRDWALSLRQQMEGASPSLGLVFMSPRFFEDATEVLEIIRVHARVPVLAGCSGVSLICNGEEHESASGISLALYHLPNAEIHACHFNQSHLDLYPGPDAWQEHAGVKPANAHGWLAFLDPFHLDSERWLNTWNAAYPGLPVMGGLASGVFPEPRTQVYLNGEVFEEGGVAVSIGGRVELVGMISQGCVPIGETWTITSVQQNVVRSIGNRPAYQVLVDTVQGLSAEDQMKARGNLFAGLVINEYLEEFHRGDFLVRNLLGADAATGAIAVGALPRLGQTLQFQRRDARAATEDMKELLVRAGERIVAREVFGGCLCTCNGRGKHLFSKANHDAAMVQRQLGPLALAGFFCNGEIGPVGEKNFLHGYTASLALFVEK
jgi:small ligand-binding sensory domain FIST